MRLGEAFGVRDGDMVAWIGAGGKTTSLFHLAAELRAEGKKVLVTTTTKIFRPAKPHVDRLFLVDDVNALLAETSRFGRPTVIAVGRSVSEDGKLVGLPVSWLEPLHASGQFDAILIEADGAASRLFKIPGESEPVVPATSTVVIWVMSVKALGKPLNAAFVHRPERAVELLGVTPETVLSPAHVAQLLTHPSGLLKGIPRCRKIALINQADTAAEIQQARALAQAIAPLQWERVVISSFVGEGPLKEIVPPHPGSR